MRTSDRTFRDKVVWITGASSGIGRSLALAFDRAGSRLILSGRDAGRLAAVRDQCSRPEQVHVLPFDVSDLEAIPRHVKAALALWEPGGGGHIDYMVHNAGIALRDRMVDTSLALAQQVMATNYFGAVALTKALLPSMLERRSGCFVVVSSLSGVYGIPQLSAYAASKHALHGCFESLRAEVHDHGIQITIVIPGIIRTRIVERALTGNGGTYGKAMAAVEHGMHPDIFAERCLRAVARGKPEAFIGGWEWVSVYLDRFFPTLAAVVIRSHPVRLRNKVVGWFSRRA